MQSVGNNLSKMTQDERAYFRGKSIGFVFQAFNLLPAVTALENVSVPLLINASGCRTYYGNSRGDVPTWSTSRASFVLHSNQHPSGAWTASTKLGFSPKTQDAGRCLHCPTPASQTQQCSLKLLQLQAGKRAEKKGHT